MRSGIWRGVTLALGLACALAASGGSAARAGNHTIPSLVPAVDVNTGGPYYAPPVPYGHYAKDCGAGAGKVGGLIRGKLLGHKGHGNGCGPCGGCGGKGCGACGGSGTVCGEGGHGGGGLGHGHGHANGGGCGANGCAAGQGGGAAGGYVSTGGNGGGLFGHNGGGAGHGHGHGAGHASTVAASGQGMPAPVFAPPVPSAQCGDPGCGLFGKSHGHRGCGLCGGKGCGGCAVSDPCNSCGGKGCGLCGGKGGLFGKHGGGCGACGGKGCGLCGGKGGLCGLCGGKGCNACAKARGLVSHLLGHDKIKWFVGAGGPVPLTPGYTPYVVTTRSPRDFLAFPPFVP